MTRMTWTTKLRSFLILFLVLLVISLLLQFILQAMGVKSSTSLGGVAALLGISADLKASPAAIRHTYRVRNDFRPINKQQIYTFFNVCLEDLEQPILGDTIVGDAVQFKVFYNETKRIVVYTNRSGYELLQVYGANGGTKLSWARQWNITFKNSLMPASHSYIDGTAFFLVTQHPGNFFHFWLETLSPLFSMINETNTSQAEVPNQIFYRRVLNFTNDPGDHLNKTAFEDLLFTLNVQKFHDTFFRGQPNTCYHSGVFGSHDFYPRRATVDHVLRAFKIPIPATGDRFITFIQRTDRKILNIDELVEAVKKLRFKKVQIVTFESLTLREQARKGAESAVMIGVQGAGLQWAIFMQPGSHAVEIAWPAKRWPHFYHWFIPGYGSAHHNMDEYNLQLNWTTFERRARGGKQLSLKEREEILKNPPADHHLDVWRWADVTVDSKKLTDLIKGFKLVI